MKIRTGFVSNSSSSSFVCIGLKVLKEHCEGLGWDHSYSVFDDEEEGYSSKTHVVIGEIIASGDDYDFDANEYTIQEITEIAQKVSEEMELLGEPVLITGVRMT